MARVLIIDEDERSQAELLAVLSSEYSTRLVTNFEHALALLSGSVFEVVVLNAAAFTAGASAVNAALRRLQDLEARPEVILLDDDGDALRVSQSLRAGAYEVVFRPVKDASLKQVVANAAQVRSFRLERRRIDAHNRQQRVDLEALVAERTHQMQQIFANVPALLFRMLVLGGYRREFTFVSQNCESLIELREADLLSDARRLERLVHPEEQARFRATREVAEAQNSSFRFEGRFILPSGQERWLQCVAQPTLLAQGAVAWDGLLVDVTERMELQSQLLLADRLAVIGTVSAALVHEVNNPLFCVSTSLVALGEELRALPSVQLRQLLEEAQSGVRRIEHAIADLRSFNPVRGEGPRAVRVTQVLDASVRLASNEIRHRARLIRDYRADPLVMADEASLAQVFLNVLIAAAQSIPEGDASGNVLEVVVWSEGQVVHVEVSDTSPGIPRERLECAFDPSESTVERLRSGVGLYASQQIVASLGGEIHATSNPGAGNYFHVAFPIVPESVEPPARPSLRVVRDLTMRILVIDDEELVVKALSRTLRGHSVTCVTSGREAIELIRSQGPFDLVLCDVMMPDVTGADVYDAARTLNTGAEERIVFVTGGAFTRSASEFLNSVPNRRIEKPFSRASIEAIIRDMWV